MALTQEGDTDALALTAVVPGTGVGHDDSALVARARLGDSSAFDELYRRYRDQVYTLCLNMCGNRDEAQDLLQETFVHACRGLSKFGGRSRFTTWLYRIAVNAVRDSARRRKRSPVPPPAQAPDLATVSHVRAALARLRQEHRDLLALRYSLSLSYQEMAECLRWPVGRVRATLHRARRAFKEEYLRIVEAKP